MISENIVIIINVKNKLRKLMKDRKLSFYKLAQMADLTEACIRNWYGTRNYTPSLEALDKICVALGITMSELFCFEEDMIPVNSEMKDLYDMWLKLDNDQREAVKVHMESYLNHKK